MGLKPPNPASYHGRFSSPTRQQHINPKIPGFDIVLNRGEAYCESTACTLLAARATASFGGMTQAEACGAAFGDFAVYQAYQVGHNDQSGFCDVTPEIDWTSAIRIR